MYPCDQQGCTEVFHFWNQLETHQRDVHKMMGDACLHCGRHYEETNTHEACILKIEGRCPRLANMSKAQVDVYFIANLWKKRDEMYMPKKLEDETTAEEPQPWVRKPWDWDEIAGDYKKMVLDGKIGKWVVKE